MEWDISIAIMNCSFFLRHILYNQSGLKRTEQFISEIFMAGLLQKAKSPRQNVLKTLVQKQDLHVPLLHNSVVSAGHMIKLMSLGTEKDNS